MTQLPYDAQKDFVPLSLLATQPFVLAVGRRTPAKTLAEFVAAARQKPGAMSYASNGRGGLQHLAMELFSRAAGIEMLHVPYKGSAGASTDLLGGHVQATIAALQTMAPFVSTGRLRMLAVLSTERSAAFPDVPTMKELGHPELVVDTWYGIFAPAGTPAPVVAKLNADIDALLGEAEIREALAKQGMAVVVDKPERLGRLVDAEIARWKRVVAAARIQGD
jgi:tripartite-type tricarboxylate transporter receptor subunit TctC